MSRGSRLLAIGLVALALSGLGGCAYFNTFYFAKKHFREAERLRLTSQTEKLPPEATKKYDEAILQSQKVIKNHAKSRWVDDAIFLMGASFYGKRDYDRAISTFEDLLREYPDSDLTPRAHYMLGLAHFERRNFESMESEFEQTLAAEPEFEEIDEILFTRAKAAERQRDLEGAVQRYREMVTQRRYGRRSDEALLRIGDLYFDAGRYDSAYASYDQLVQTTRTETSYQEGRLKSAEALVRLGRPRDAIDLLEPLLPQDEKQNRTASEFPPRVRLQLARAWNALEEPMRAIETLRAVSELYNTSLYATEAQFQIGYTYEVFLDSLEAAKTAYEEATRLSARSVFREQAQSRLENLRRLQELSTEVSGGDVDADAKAEASLRIAELFLFSQDRPDDARAAYRQLLTELPDSPVAARAEYGLAWIDLRKEPVQRDSAFARFRGLVAKYPTTQQARAAIELLSDEGGDTTGLRALLVEPAPEPAAIDSAGATADTLAGAPFSPLATGADSLDADGLVAGRPVPLIPQTARTDAYMDSLRRVQADSARAFVMTPAARDSIRRARAQADSVRRVAAEATRRAAARKRAVEDSLRRVADSTGVRVDSTLAPPRSGGSFPRER